MLGDPISNPGVISKIRGLCCKLVKSGLDIPFPGSQPVSLYAQNMNYPRHKPYAVTWKADGTRALCLAMNHGVYLIDRSGNLTLTLTVILTLKKTNQRIKVVSRNSDPVPPACHLSAFSL